MHLFLKCCAILAVSGSALQPVYAAASQLECNYKVIGIIDGMSVNLGIKGGRATVNSGETWQVFDPITGYTIFAWFTGSDLGMQFKYADGTIELDVRAPWSRDSSILRALTHPVNQRALEDLGYGAYNIRSQSFYCTVIDN